jgi:hypothetical protein
LPKAGFNFSSRKETFWKGKVIKGKFLFNVANFAAALFQTGDMVREVALFSTSIRDIRNVFTMFGIRFSRHSRSGSGYNCTK